MRSTLLHIGRRAILASCILLGGCGTPVLDRPDRTGIIDLDGGTQPPPPAPQVEAFSSRQPYLLASLRGRAEGRRIYVEGLGNRRVYPIQPDGRFCLDIPLPTPGTHVLYLIAQSQDGQLSEPAGPFSVEFDSAAAVPVGAVTCTGANPNGCASPFEICGNGVDDDCNALVDAQDPRCAPCQDDILEPNDEAGSPRLAPNQVYPDLKLCAGNEDWFGVYLDVGQRLEAQIRFTHAEGDLDLSLTGPDPSAPLTESRTLLNVEELSHTASIAGTYHLRVFGSDITSNIYALELTVRSR